MAGNDERQFDAIVVGAGMSGLYMLHRLRGLGLTVRVYEAGDGIGGTWYWNRYPGARCDIESIDYSFSFSSELEQEWEWSERYPSQPEILRYLEHVADRFDLRRDITLGTRVTAAHFDEESGRWHIETDTGERASARFCVMAAGCLSLPKPPEVEGAKDFAGPTYHTARWPEEEVDFTGKRVGVIGTGSSGIQVIPIIAEQAAHLTVFQRTPNFTVPARNAPLDPQVAQAVKADYPERRQQARASFFGVPVDPPTQSALEVSPEERQRRYARAWADGGLNGMMGAYIDLFVVKDANDTAAEFVRERIREIVRDPKIADKLCPTGYPFAAKRLCLDNGYYATFNRPNVTLVDLRDTPLVRITPRGVQTTAADHDLDMLVFATGFDAMTGPLLAIDIRGRGGVSLRERWAEGPRTYLGLGVAGFPNLFTITGPGSPSAVSNMVVSIEQHVDWIADCLAYLREHGLDTIEPTQQAQESWFEHVLQVGAATLFPQADSWYMGANVPGKPRVLLPYVGGVGTYRMVCDNVAAEGYKGFALSSSQ